MPQFDAMEEWGWTADWSAKLSGIEDLELTPARVVRQERDQFFLVGPDGPVVGVLTGNYRKSKERPVTGDWVGVKPIDKDAKVLIEAVLPRQSELARQGAGEKTVKQVIAANVDWVFILVGLDNDFNMRRLERYLRLVSGRNVKAAVILNKVDVADDLAAALEEVRAVAVDLPIVPLSATTGEGVDALMPMLKAGETMVCVGSSGVGKSTLVNQLMGEEILATFEVREGDDRGRHTTTQRELIKLPSGALMIDTPGIRELSEWQEKNDEETVDRAFADIEDLAEECKFNDCSHKNEPGCAVLAALEEGALDEGRYHSYRKLQEELRAQVKRQEQAEKNKTRHVRGRSRRIKSKKKK